VLTQCRAFSRAGQISEETDQSLSSVCLILRKQGPTASVRLLNLRKRRPTGLARIFVTLKKHRPANPQAGVFLSDVKAFSCMNLITCPPESEGLDRSVAHQVVKVGPRPDSLTSRPKLLPRHQRASVCLWLDLKGRKDLKEAAGTESLVVSQKTWK